MEYNLGSDWAINFKSAACVAPELDNTKSTYQSIVSIILHDLVHLTDAGAAYVQLKIRNWTPLIAYLCDRASVTRLIKTIKEFSSLIGYRQTRFEH